MIKKNTIALNEEVRKKLKDIQNSYRDENLNKTVVRCIEFMHANDANTIKIHQINKAL